MAHQQVGGHEPPLLIGLGLDTWPQVDQSLFLLRNWGWEHQRAWTGCLDQEHINLEAIRQTCTIRDREGSVQRERTTGKNLRHTPTHTTCTIKRHVTLHHSKLEHLKNTKPRTYRVPPQKESLYLECKVKSEWQSWNTKTYPLWGNNATAGVFMTGQE